MTTPARDQVEKISLVLELLPASRHGGSSADTTRNER